MAEWNFPKFDLTEMDTSKISEYVNAETLAGSSEIDDQLPAMMEHFKQIAKAEGKEFDEKQFNEMMGRISKSMGGTYLLGIDNAIIAVGYGQFVLEGKIDEDVKTLTKTAINRELLPMLIDRWDGEYKKTRVEQLTKMLSTLDKMNE